MTVSNGGRHLTALKSAASGGRISRIVPRIEPPHPVTLPNYLADAVITWRVPMVLTSPSSTS